MPKPEKRLAEIKSTKLILKVFLTLNLLYFLLFAGANPYPKVSSFDL